VSRSFGTGSPVFFRCHSCRSTIRGGIDGEFVLTGRVRPSRFSGPVGSRSTFVTREYTCSCGHTGWSNHIDLAIKSHPEIKSNLRLSYYLRVKNGVEVDTTPDRLKVPARGNS
jgi:hypothetical protein